MKRIKPEKEVSFLKLQREQYKNYNYILLTVHVFENAKVVNPIMGFDLEETSNQFVLEGKCGECATLLSYIAGTWDYKKLLECTFQDAPKSFKIETWTKQNEYEWQMTKETYWNGVKWLNAAHTNNTGDSICGAIATFTCEEKTIKNIDGPIMVVPYSALEKTTLKHLILTHEANNQRKIKNDK